MMRYDNRNVRAGDKRAFPSAKYGDYGGASAEKRLPGETPGNSPRFPRFQGLSYGL